MAFGEAVKVRQMNFFYQTLLADAVSFYHRGSAQQPTEAKIR